MGGSNSRYFARFDYNDGGVTTDGFYEDTTDPARINTLQAASYHYEHFYCFKIQKYGLQHWYLFTSRCESDKRLWLLMLEQPDDMPFPEVTASGAEDTCGSKEWLQSAIKSHKSFLASAAPASRAEQKLNEKFSWIAVFAGRMGLKKQPDDVCSSAKELARHCGRKRLSHNILYTLVDALGGVATHRIARAAQHENAVCFASSDAVQSKGWQERVELCLLYDIPIVPVNWLLLLQVPAGVESRDQSKTFIQAVQDLAKRRVRLTPDSVLQVSAGSQCSGKTRPDGSGKLVIRTKRTNSEAPATAPDRTQGVVS